ncbi:hypothetical protein CVT25_011736 [Psilocybe cyanescens]|uniref:Uncharacterized protein n=1 Tax=Psilocybe cyanescens TaxID=93625 RepID=A0A409WIE0_PSICY|nr:hypothetical protein CVT25_011736 [Psilocybe cyanescens]
MSSAYTPTSSGPTSLFSTSINDQCTFNVYPESSNTVLQYNVCPLLIGSNGVKSIQVIKDEDTPPTHTRHIYDIAMMGTNGLEWDGTLPSSLQADVALTRISIRALIHQCPTGTWICLTVINSRPDHPSEPLRVLQVMPISTVEKSNPKASYVSENLENHLQVAFHGGRYMGKKNKALFHFTCDQKNSSPNLLWSFNGTHSFSWASKHGCPISSPITTIRATPTSPSQPDSEPSDKPPQQSEDSDATEDIFTNITLGIVPIASLAIIFSVIFWALCMRRISRVASAMTGTSRVWILRRPPNLHRWSKSRTLIQQEEVSVLLEDFTVDSREPLSPKDSMFPKYGL